MLCSVDTATSQPGSFDMPQAEDDSSTVASSPAIPWASLSPNLLDEFWRAAGGETCELSAGEFGAVLATIGAKHNHGLPPGAKPSDSQCAVFFRSLHLSELALAHACARGRERAWERFVGQYRAALVQAGASISGSAALGAELADSLYAELYGLRQVGGKRDSPLASYSGRGSLSGWLRATLVQRFRDHLRRTRREAPLEDFDSPVTETPAPHTAELSALTAAVAQALGSLAAEDRFLLAAYYLDRQTLLEIARTLQVHEATIGRRLKRLLAETRKQLLRQLVAGGLSKAAAEEALGADPRDVEINLRALLQTSQLPAFSQKEDAALTQETDSR
jgi:RNA polymerase sigma-70 factor (ECF subfamily)